MHVSVIVFGIEQKIEKLFILNMHFMKLIKMPFTAIRFLLILWRVLSIDSILNNTYVIELRSIDNDDD